MYRSIKIPVKISVRGWLMVLAGIASVIVLSSSAARAATVTNNYADYGHVSNGYTGNNSATPGQNVGGPYCAATSVANSLRFLANKYGGVYANLVPGTTAQARDAIVDLETLDNSNPPNVGKNGKPPSPAVSNATLWNSKVNYINSHIDPSKINIEGYIPGNLAGYAEPANTTLLNGIPTLAWLMGQMQQGQDVEIAFKGIPINNEDTEDSEDAEDAHMVTLTGMTDVPNGDGNYPFEYLDPNNPSNLIDAAFDPDVNGTLYFNWNNGVNDPVNGVDVYQAWSESPVPEPMSFGLLIVGGALSMRSRRRAA